MRVSTVLLVAIVGTVYGYGKLDGEYGGGLGYGVAVGYGGGRGYDGGFWYGGAGGIGGGAVIGGGAGIGGGAVIGRGAGIGGASYSDLLGGGMYIY